MHKTQNTTPWVSRANPTKFNKTLNIPFPKFLNSSCLKTRPCSSTVSDWVTCTHFVIFLNNKAFEKVKICKRYEITTWVAKRKAFFDERYVSTDFIIAVRLLKGNQPTKAIYQLNSIFDFCSNTENWLEYWLLFCIIYEEGHACN